MQGDIVAVYSDTGVLLTTYVYDAWGNFSVSYSNGGASTTATKNPFTYRGYYYDKEYGFYCLGTRFYDPVTRRFINADTHVSLNLTPTTLTDKNLYTYCDNNPVMRTDSAGAFWETAFDVVSLAVSIVDVCSNPDDAMAWVGLVGDAIDLIPFVAGVGETVRAVNIGRKTADLAEDVYDTAKIAKKATTGTSNQIGRIGESLAGIDANAKRKILVNGRVRIPDALSEDVLTEVKNVKYLSNTKQLRDFAEYAKQTNRTMDLYVRPTTKLSKSLQDAGWNIKYLW